MSVAYDIPVDGSALEMEYDVLNHCNGLPFPREVSLDLRTATIEKYGFAVGQRVLQWYQAGYVEL